MAQGANEPSMEEILSSIKRIIAEENDAPSPRARRSRVQVSPVSGDEESEVLELTETAPESETVEFPPAALPPAPSGLSAPVMPAPAAPVTREELISDTTAAASRQALAALSRLIVKPEDPAADNTLEGLVREMLRPMLKEWLDARLPEIVNAAVEREVARISGRPV